MTRQDRLAVYLFACLFTAGCAVDAPSPTSQTEVLIERSRSAMQSNGEHIDKALQNTVTSGQLLHDLQYQIDDK